MIGYLEKEKKQAVIGALFPYQVGTSHTQIQSGNGLLIESKHSLVGEREWRVQTKETRFYIAHKRNVPVFNGKYIQ